MIPKRLKHAAGIRKGRVFGLMLAGALVTVAAPGPGSCLAASEPAPVVTRVTLVTGAPELLLPGVSIANLDAGDLVAGSTRWDNDGDGIVFNDTHVGFLWSPADGPHVFDIDDTLYWNPNFHFPSAISDNRTVVGTDYFRLELKAFPFLWTPTDGFHFLPLPCPGQPLDLPGAIGRAVCTGAASGVSADGSIAVGLIRKGSFAPVPSQAARWTATRTGPRLRLSLDLLDTPDTWSDAWAVSADGSVIVGDSGPSDTELAAARWVGGVRQPLEAVGNASTARFTSADGSAAIGWATVGAQNVLVRWDGDGTAFVAAPPAGTTIESVRAINPAATAAVGALSQNGNWAPFVWTMSGGFTVIPELGREQDYDRSEALSVSADGNAVVGALQASVQSDAGPKPLGFLWTPSTGLLPIDDLLAAAGYANPGIYQASAISGDGRRILATGNPTRTDHDTNSVIIELSSP